MMAEVSSLVSDLETITNNFGLRLESLRRVKDMLVSSDETIVGENALTLLVPLTTQLTDTRASIVRDACSCIVLLAKRAEDETFSQLLPMALPPLLDLHVANNCVVSDASIACIDELLRVSGFGESLEVADILLEFVRSIESTRVARKELLQQAASFLLYCNEATLAHAASTPHSTPRAGHIRASRRVLIQTVEEFANTFGQHAFVAEVSQSILPSNRPLRVSLGSCHGNENEEENDDEDEGCDVFSSPLAESPLSNENENNMEEDDDVVCFKGAEVTTPLRALQLANAETPVKTPVAKPLMRTPISRSITRMEMSTMGVQVSPNFQVTETQTETIVDKLDANSQTEICGVDVSTNTEQTPCNEEELDTLRNELSERASEESAVLTAEVERLESELTNEKEEVQQLRDILKGYDETMESLIEGSDRAASLEVRVAEKTEMYNVLERRFVELRQKYDGTKVRLEAAAQHETTLRGEIETKQRSLMDMQSKYNALREHAEEKLAGSRATLVALRKEIEKKAENEKNGREITASAVKDAEAAREISTKLEIENKELKARLYDLQQSANKVESLETENAELRLLCQQALDKLEHSDSS